MRTIMAPELVAVQGLRRGLCEGQGRQWAPPAKPDRMASWVTVEHDPEKWMPVFGKDHAPSLVLRLMEKPMRSLVVALTAVAFLTGPALAQRGGGKGHSTGQEQPKKDEKKV